MASAVEQKLQTSAFEQQHKLFLTDMQKPNTKGMAAVQKIKTDPRAKHFPVVLLSSSKMNQEIRSCNDFGVNGLGVQAVHFQGHKKAIKSLHFYRLLLNQPFS